MAFIEIERSTKQEDWSMHDLHSHPHYEIYLLNKGERSFFLRNSLYVLKAPTLIVIPPYVMHKTEGGPFDRYNVNVSAAYLDPFQKDVLNKKSLQIIPLKEKAAAQFISIFDECIALDKRKKHADHITKALFSYAVVALQKCNAKTLQPSAAASEDIPPLVLKIIEYLHLHFAEKITLESLSETFFISKGMLMYNFKKYINCSPIDFLLKVRLTKAKEMLVNTAKSVCEISEQCGFSSANYFGLIFKSKEGISPATYRKNQRAKL